MKDKSLVNKYKYMNIYRHGELLLKETTLPENAVRVDELKEKVLAHSETGHDHILTSEKPFNVFEHNGDTYIMTFNTADLWHKKTGADVHTTHKVEPAVYKVIIKREFDYFKNAIVRVRD